MATFADRLRETLTFVGGRRRDYIHAFTSPAGNRVLTDLAKFCRAADTCVVVTSSGPIDRERTLILEGRREVFLRIQQHLNLTPEQLYTVLGGQMVTTGEDDG